MSIIARVENYCKDILTNSDCRKLPFHNLRHTQEVVSNVKLLSRELQLSASARELLEIAAWFHDTGFFETYKGHEEKSIAIAINFLNSEGLNVDSIDLISSCIKATKMPQQPDNEYAEVLCDADIFHISTPNFFYRKLLLRREWETFCDLHLSDLEWHNLNLEFLKEHHFKTSYGQKILEAGKMENLKKVQQIIEYY